MTTIYKYPVQVSDEFTISMPPDAKLLTVQTQGGSPFIWALVDVGEDPVVRRFALRGTGHDCAGLGSATYVGTFQMRSGAVVFHLFDMGVA